MNKFLAVFLCAILSQACNDQGNDTTNVNLNAQDLKYVDTTYTTIDLERIDELSAESFGNKVSTITYIPLEGSNSPVGAINDIVINNKYIVILDRERNKRIFIYDRKGRLMRVINALGHGRGEYLEPSSIEIDNKTGYLCVKDDKQSKFLYYDMNGKFIKDKKTIASIYAIHTGNYVVNQLAAGQTYNRDVNYHIFISEDDSVVYKGFPYHKIQTDFVVSNKFRYNYKNELLFHPVISDTVYHLMPPDSYCAKYVFRNKQSLWNKADEKLYFNEITDLVKKQGYSMISDFHESKEFVFYSIYSFHKDVKQIMNIPYFYDKREHISYHVQNIPNGEIKFFAPLDLLCVYSDWCVAYFNPYTLKMQMGDEYYISEPYLKNIVENASPSSNPVLVFYKLK